MVTREDLAKEFSLKPSVLDNEFAILRHCQLIKAKKEGREQELIQRYHKQVIRNPLCAKDAPYYDEG